MAAAAVVVPLTAGCAAAAPVIGSGAAAASQAVGTAALGLVAIGVMEGFGQQLSQEIVESAPGFARETMDMLRRAFDEAAPSIWGRYNGDELAPSLTLRSLAAGAQFTAEDGNLRAVVVHDVADGRRLELPAIVQIGLNFLIRKEAGDKGMLLGRPEGVSRQEFQSELARLRPEYVVVQYDAHEGADAYLNKPGLYDVSNELGDTVRITWTPAYPKKASRSTLLVQKGLVAAGSKPRWKVHLPLYLSHGLLFGDMPSTT